MKRFLTGLLAALCLLSLAACARPAEPAPANGAEPKILNVPSAEPAEAAEPAQPDHSHSPTEENNIVEHEAAGYCGNTVTTICGYPNGDEESFWGSDSVALTDLLCYLEYRDGVCRCAPEYMVTTEFGGPYGLNLTDAYVRNGDKQAPLSQEQVEEIAAILARLPQDG